MRYSQTVALLAAMAALTGTVRADIQPEDASAPDVRHGAPLGVSVHRTNPFPGLGPVPEAKTGSARPVSGNGINYHGGPLMTASTVNIYTIWYGNWSGNTAKTIIGDFFNEIGGSPYYNINTTYYDGANKHLINSIQVLGSVDDNYSHGTSLTDSAIKAVVDGAISAGKLQKDPNGIYFVLTSSDVTASSGFCTQYCGWHTHGSTSGTDIKYAFIGNPDRCPSACSAQTTGPNGNAGADGMISIIAHELEEAASDPDLNAWYDVRGMENADKCAWTFGTTYTTANGAQANMKLKAGSRDYLIQRNWVNDAGGYCDTKYPKAP